MEKHTYRASSWRDVHTSAARGGTSCGYSRSVPPDVHLPLEAAMASNNSDAARAACGQPGLLGSPLIEATPRRSRRRLLAVANVAAAEAGRSAREH